jgi:hypothetical protein
MTRRNSRSAPLLPYELGILAATLGLAAAVAGGPIEIRHSELPKPIAKLHTCVPKTGTVQMNPLPAKAGNSGVVISVGCPLDGPDVAAIASQHQWQQELHQALYLARGKTGIGARRLTFPYPKPDGTQTVVNVLPVTPSIGWTTRAQTSKLNGAAFLDMQKPSLPAGAFHMVLQFAPADRPELKGVIAVWLVERGASSLIYWAETTEVLRGENPHWIYPQYKVKLDKRPE